MKDFKNFNEGLADHVYGPTESPESKPEVKQNAPAEAKPEPPKEVKQEEEEVISVPKILESCVDNVEEIVGMFEKDDQKLVDMVLPILDLCQTNLNFQEKKTEGHLELMETSKKLIKELVDKLRKAYPNNDPVRQLIQNCDKLK